MNPFMKKISTLFAPEKKRKSYQPGAHVTLLGPGLAQWNKRDYNSFAKEGYQKNVIAHRCISEIARSIGLVPFKLFLDREVITEHPLLNLLRRPNPLQGSSAFIEAVVSTWLISGNAFIEIVGDEPEELYNLRPDRMKIEPGKNGLPAGYIYQLGTKSYRYDADPVTGRSLILHLRFFHPTDDWYGLSPIEAASFSIDQHNAAGEHNQSLLQNGARPMGALIHKPHPESNFTSEQRQKLTEQIEEKYTGVDNAGRVLLLDGDFSWQEMGLKPRDMDFIEAKSIAARDIAQAFGVPPVLVGIPGDSTYNNMAEARIALWEQTIIPLLDHMTDMFNHWLIPLYPKSDGLNLRYDLDQVPALAPRRQMVWERIQNADFLTRNEKREALGYPPLDAA